MKSFYAVSLKVLFFPLIPKFSTKIKTLEAITMIEPKLNEDLAELYGAMIGDGCLSNYLSNYEKREIFCTLITGHTHDYHYYKKILQPIMLNEFGIKGCIRFRSDCNATRFETTFKSVFDFFKESGFPVGLKKNLFIPNAIIHDNNLSIACIRGIFDTDGSIYSRYSKRYSNHLRHYNYLVIQFKLKSKEVINQIKLILDRNNIKTTKIGDLQNMYYVVRITSQESIHKFMELVKPSNKYHTARYLNKIDFRNDTGP